MYPDLSLPDCNSESVFEDVMRRARPPAVRSLWGRMREEMGRSGTGSAITYLEGEFTRLREEFEKELKRRAAGE